MRMRTLAVSGLFALTMLVAPGCEKSGDTNTPEPADALSDVDDGKTRLKYSESGFELTTVYAEEFTVSGGAAGERSIKTSGTIVATPHGDGKLRVELTNGTDVELVEEGAMKPEPEEGEEPVDTLALLKGAKSWYVMDRIGEIDSDASKALPENVERKAKRDAAEKKRDEGESMARGDLDMGASIGLPPLPTTGLVLGETTKLPTQEEVQETAGGDMDVEIDAIYTLTAIDEVGGNKHATVDIEVVSSGAAELDFGQGSTFVAFDAETTGTLVFDLTAGVPVKWEGDSLSEIHFGEKTFEQNQTTVSTFALAGAGGGVDQAAPDKLAAPEDAAKPMDEAAAPVEGEAAPAEGESEAEGQ